RGMGGWWGGGGGRDEGVRSVVTLSQAVDHCLPHCDVDTARLSLSGVYLGQLAVVAVAALAVAGEYDTMMIRTTLGATPRRLTVLAAQLAGGTTGVLRRGLPPLLPALAAA